MSDQQLESVVDETTGLTVVMLRGEREPYERFRRSMLEDLKPEGFLEQVRAFHLIQDNWRYRRFIEMQRIGEMQGADYNPVLCDILARKQRMIGDSTRSYLKQQEQRRAERDRELDKAAALAELNQSRGQTYNPDFDFPPGNGFAFSIHEIEVRILRNRRLKEAKALARKHRPR